MTTGTAAATPGLNIAGAIAQPAAAGGGARETGESAMVAKTTKAKARKPNAKAAAPAARKVKKPAARAAKTSPQAKKPAARAAAKTPQKAVAGANLISVFGPFNSRVLIEMPAVHAHELFAELGEPTAHSRVIDAVEQEIQQIRERARTIADGQLAATAIALAYELEHPYNSATSKSMCARALNETMDRLRELAPAKPERDGIDDLARKRDTRRSGVTRKTRATASLRS